MLSGRIARTDHGRQTNALAPAVVVISEQPYTNRANRRHIRTDGGKMLIIPPDQRQQGLNEPHRTAPTPR